MNPKKIFILFFIIIVSVPTFMIPFYESSTLSENRAPVKFPQFTPQYPILMKRNFERYYDSNFAFRNHLYSIYQYYKWNIIGSNPFFNDVVVGKSGWLFQGNNSFEHYDQALAIVPNLESQLDSSCVQMNKMKSFCDSLNIDFYIAVGPNKATIYPEYLPITPLEAGRTLKTFKSLMKNKYNIEVIDLGDYFSKADSKQRLYYKTDSHWNYNGAFLGTQKLLDVIRQKYPVDHLLIGDYNEIPVEYTKMDLSRVLDVSINEKDIKLQTFEKQFTESNSYVYYDQFKLSILETEHRSMKNTIKCIVFRDSFFKNMQEFFCNNVSNVIVAFQRFDKELILKERPQFVVYELVECRILSFDMNEYYL